MNIKIINYYYKEKDKTSRELGILVNYYIDIDKLIDNIL